MKKILNFILISSVLFASCTKKPDSAETAEIQQEEIQQPEPEILAEEPPAKIEEPKKIEEPEKIPEKIIEETPKKEEPPKKEPEPIKNPEPEKKEEPKPKVEEKSEIDEEYARSVGDIAVTRDEFVEDKKEILGIIDKLSTIMAKKDFQSWVNLLDSESVSYWKQSGNLKKAQSRLPIKGIQLRTLEDYFKYIFIPARQNRSITEIRYISDKYVKAIEVKEDADYVYYYFNKVNGKWMLHIPSLSE